MVTPPSSAPGSGFYLRAWYAQALPPRATFSWLPVLTITDGTVIDGNVAVPAIYPGPLLIVPTARWISDAGSAAIADQARQLGLLSGETDFSGPDVMPGSRTGRLEIIVEGVSYELGGNPDAPVRCDAPGRCVAEPRTPQAFAAFWQMLLNLDPWLGDELGARVPYRPETVAVLFIAPVSAEPRLERLVTWPFDDETFLEVGVEFPGGEPSERCRTYAGQAAATLLPVLLGADQATVFHDAVDSTRSLVAAVLVPGQESPCPD